MKKAFLAPLALVAAFALPALVLAASYQYEYVNTSGNLEMVTADSATDALAMATDRDPHSGVDLVVPSNDPPEFAAAGTYIMPASASAQPGVIRALVLGPDGTAALATDYQNGQTPVAEIGTWVMTGSNQLTLTLTGTLNNQTYAPAHTIVFSQNGSQLHSTTFDSTLYGTNGLTFTFLN